MDDDIVEQILYTSSEVSIYKIPTRGGADGYRSGDWKVGDKILDGRLRIVAKRDLCEIIIEDRNSFEMFAVCPVELEKRSVAVEPVLDSSRYFVLRLEDRETKRHAFVGMGFDKRDDAFDFQASLSDQARRLERRRLIEGETLTGTAADPSAAQSVAALHQHHRDLSLKDGQSIKINLKKHAKKEGGFLSTAAVQPFLMPPPPPPAAVVAPPTLMAPGPAPPVFAAPAPAAAQVESGWASFD